MYTWFTGNTILKDRQKSLKIGQNEIDSIIFGSSGDWFATASGSTDISVWNFNTRDELVRFQGHKFAIMGMALSPDESKIASYDAGDVIKVWNLSDGKEVFSFINSSKLTTIAYGRQSGEVITGDESGTLKSWQVITGS